MASKGSKKGYAWLKSRLQDRFDEEERLREEAVQEMMEAAEPGTWIRWLPRLFGEFEEGKRREILRSLVPKLGEKTISFLGEVLDAPTSGLAEKRIALEQLEKLGAEPDKEVVRNLRKAEDFVALPPEALTNAGGTVPEEALDRFRGLPPLFEGLVLRELLRRPEEGVFRFVERVLTARDDLWEEILEDLEASPSEEAGRLLQAGYGTAGKTLRKKIRRAAHKRSVRGLPVYPLETEEAGEAVWRPPAPPKPEGLHSLPDPLGGRMVWVIRPRAPKGMLLFGGWVDEQRGLAKFFVMDPTRKELEHYKDSLLTNPEFTVVECNAGFCASLLEEAYQKGAPVDPEEVEAFKAARPLLRELIPPERPEAPIYGVFPDGLQEAVVGDPLGESARLLKESLLSGWAIESERIQPYLERLEEIARSRIIVHPLQKKERMDALFREVTKEILSDPVYRYAWRRRLEDTAWVLHKKNLEGHARRLAHMSRYLQDPEKDPSQISFFVELVRKGMEGNWEEKQAEEKRQPSLIVKP